MSVFVKQLLVRREKRADRRSSCTGIQAIGGLQDRPDGHAQGGGASEQIVKLAERKLFVTFTNVTTGSGTTVSGLRRAVQPWPDPVQCGIASRTCRRARRVYTAHSPTYPP